MPCQSISCPKCSKGAIRDSHLAIMILNKFICDPKNPLERNVAQVYQRIIALGAKPDDRENRSRLFLQNE